MNGVRENLLAAFSLLSIVNTSHAASRVFYDGFEDGTTNAWQQNDIHPRCPVSTSASGAHGGTHMAECNWDGGSYSGLKVAWSYSSQMLIRFWVRYDEDCDHVIGSKLWRMGSSLNSIGAAQLEQGDAAPLYMNWFDASSNPLAPVYWPNVGQSPPLGDHQWHRVELYFKNGNGDGVIHVWIDGASIYNVNNAVSDTSGWSPFLLMSNWSMNPGWEHDASNHVYWDDFEIYSDSNAGTLATGFMSDATINVSNNAKPPSPPKNLKVR